MDWNTLHKAVACLLERRSPCESVDWNALSISACALAVRRSPCESVDWNAVKLSPVFPQKRRSPCESVDWNHKSRYGTKKKNVSLSLRERGLKSQEAIRNEEKKWSLSLRERGLKLLFKDIPSDICRVALLARAWIEISRVTTFSPWSKSLSLRERGLKYNHRIGDDKKWQVALLARAWIEMVMPLIWFNWVSRRSPCESVDWNYQLLFYKNTSNASLSLRERGLKCKISAVQMHCGGVALLARAWIEMVIPLIWFSWVSVALLARAWIEMVMPLIWFNWVSRRSPCESVDWNFSMSLSILAISCRSPCESVDWNYVTAF